MEVTREAVSSFQDHSINHDLGSIGFRNLTAGYYVLENQKMEMSTMLDSMNMQLKNKLITLLNIN